MDYETLAGLTGMTDDAMMSDCAWGAALQQRTGTPRIVGNDAGQ